MGLFNVNSQYSHYSGILCGVMSCLSSPYQFSVQYSLSLCKQRPKIVKGALADRTMKNDKEWQGDQQCSSTYSQHKDWMEEEGEKRINQKKQFRSFLSLFPSSPHFAQRPLFLLSFFVPITRSVSFFFLLLLQMSSSQFDGRATSSTVPNRTTNSVSVCTYVWQMVVETGTE